MASTPDRDDAPFSLLLDLARLLAALAVVFGHARGWLFVEYAQVASPGLLDRLVYALAFGHEAVMVFFVLSGWLVGGACWSRIAAGTFDAREYAVSRATRLGAVLVPSMVLSLVVFVLHRAVGIQLLDVDDLGIAASDMAFPRDPWSLYGPVTFVGNVLGLMTLVVPCYGENGALWSLSHEILFYALAPALGFVVHALWTRTFHARVIPSALILALAALSLPAYYRETFAIWCGGGLAAMVTSRVRVTERGPWILATWVGLVAALLASRAHRLPGPFNDGIVALAFAAPLMLHRVSRLRAGWIRTGLEKLAQSAGGAIRRLAGSSFSLYVTHPIVLVVAATALLGDRVRWAPGAVPYAVFVGLLLTCIVVAETFAAATEHRTASLRARVLSRLKVPSRR